MFDFEFTDIDSAAGQHDRPTSGPYLPDASDCLRCGVCIGGCPTYRLFQCEEETPRARVRTLSKLLVENLPIDAEERQHLDNCVQCRACESVCPSKMAYGQLFDQAGITVDIKPGLKAKIAYWLIEHKRWRAGLMPLLALYLRSGLQKPLRSMGVLERLGLRQAEALAARPAVRPLAVRYPAKAECRGRVALFTGCLAEHFDRDTLQAATRLLNAIGFEVLIPAQQSCCGAIHQHNGQAAAALIENNIRVFNALDVDAVIHTATGCGAMLSEYPADSDEGARFGRRLYDIDDFLLAHWPDALTLRPFAGKIAVHEPCSQRNVLKNQQAVYALLAKIPGATVEPLADNAICCGAGGSYMLTHPQNAERLRAWKRHAIEASAADLVVSSNFGCAFFLNAESGQTLHPLSLLEMLMDIEDDRKASNPDAFRFRLND